MLFKKIIQFICRIPEEDQKVLDAIIKLKMIKAGEGGTIMIDPKEVIESNKYKNLVGKLNAYRKTK